MDFLKQLRKSGLSKQQKKTLKGQFISGDVQGALKGYTKLMKKGTEKNAVHGK